MSGKKAKALRRAMKAPTGQDMALSPEDTAKARALKTAIRVGYRMAKRQYREIPRPKREDFKP